jgi:hypothetical protein
LSIESFQEKYDNDFLKRKSINIREEPIFILIEKTGTLIQKQNTLYQIPLFQNINFHEKKWEVNSFMTIDNIF